ncbi:MAG: redoxin domain-containing protein [Bacteroidaceae bacterium]|jgi:thiol-disulfide isomerase/thioredoxin|nr:redoxin domain-containing protein [Bacteroidaceae bacterium]MBQ6050191.1 redoxin domain-containing protein [Bacteroidaceae bacterium]MBR3547573.1 redoxin domain-containing protein [Bacteroidaceae bacterium]MBR4527521.1 redoxin domain-containing protein [Bacteroidaceae bacterium]
MKKMILGAFAALILMAACTSENKNELRVKCNLEGVGDTLIVSIGDQDTTITGEAGKFDFTLPLSQVERVVAYTPGTNRMEEQNFFFLTAVPGETAEVSGQLPDNYKINGSRFYENLSLIESEAKEAKKEFDDFIADLISRRDAGESEDSLNALYESKYEVLQKATEDKIMDIIKSNSKNEAAATLVASFSDVESMRKAFDLLSDEVKNGRMKDIALKPINELEASEQREKESAAKQAPGVEAPDFTLNDINGNPFTLSSLRGKYVILDFWGSWCGWCIKGFPEMKQYYQKYKGKFEILGVDCSDTEEAWKKAVSENQLPWLHVFNPQDNKNLQESYGITGYPTKIIVGPDGKIVKTIVGEDPKFYEFLDELFGK